MGFVEGIRPYSKYSGHMGPLIHLEANYINKQVLLFFSSLFRKQALACCHYIAAPQ